MFLPGAEQVGLRLWRKWVLAGRRDEAEPCPDGPGWTLAYRAETASPFLPRWDRAARFRPAR